MVLKYLQKYLYITENVVGLGPLLLKSFSGYPSSGGTMILHHCEGELEIVCIDCVNSTLY